MKLDILFHYNVDEQTGEIKYIGKEEIKVDTTEKKSTTKKASKEIDTNPEPIVTLESNKLILTQGAATLLNAEPDCRISVKYKKQNKTTVPVIGTGEAFGTEKAGNKLTQKLTVSFRGEANDKLSAYGTEFKLEPTDKEGIFYLKGEITPEVPQEMVDIEKELDVEGLDELDSSDLGNFDFTL